MVQKSAKSLFGLNVYLPSFIFSLGVIHKRCHGRRGDNSASVIKSVTMGGGGGSKNVQNCVTSYMNDPLSPTLFSKVCVPWQKAKKRVERWLSDQKVLLYFYQKTSVTLLLFYFLCLCGICNFLPACFML